MNRSIESASAVADRINRDGGTAMAISTDVLDMNSLENARRTIEEAWSPVTILINGAGGNHPKGNTGKEYLFAEDLKKKQENLTTFFDLDIEGFRYVFDLNLLGALQTTQVFSRGMAEAGSGTIINLSSMSSYSPLTKVPAYSGAKAAVNNLTQWLATHFSKVGIRVNAIAPGFFLTNQNLRLLKNEDGSWTERAAKILNNIPMDRLGTPEDLIGTLLWLVDSRASAYVTGTVIPVDGGFSAYHGV
jgi:NAD(P)-dependent dehydrogenase (short-subunit alcohol dehydrogenase family)